MKSPKEVLDSNLPQGISLIGDIYTAVIKSMNEYASQFQKINKDYTHISILLDKSGSMNTIKDDIIGGFNSLIDEQKLIPGKLTISLIKFDSNYDPLFEFVDINNINKLDEKNYMPRGYTALNDSFARLIIETDSKITEMEEKPSKVMFVSITDGKENSSTKYKENSKLKELISKYEKENNWEFIYIGANQDSFTESVDKGIKRSFDFMATSDGVGKMYTQVSSVFKSYRTSGHIDENLNNDNN